MNQIQTLALQKSLEEIKHGGKPRKRHVLAGKIYIFGAGFNGQWLYKVLHEKNLTPVGFLDENCHISSIENIPVYPLKIISEEKDCIIIVSFFISDIERREKIIQKLMQYGVDENKIFFSFELFMEEYFNKELISANKSKVIQAGHLLNDEESIDTYCSFFEAIYMNDWHLFRLPCKEKQYIPTQIIKSNTLNRVVDCGAFIGDTLESLLEYDTFDSYIGFEPDFNNFNLLCKKIKNIKGRGEFIAFPCGTHSSNSLHGFVSSTSANSSPGGSISNQGDTVATFVALDSVIHDWHPTYIKMDVEGSEKESILGAQNIIKKYHPDLAICTYHQTCDIWEIPLLIKSIYPNYKFYLRTYYLYAREMVLYAISDE